MRIAYPKNSRLPDQKSFPVGVPKYREVVMLLPAVLGCCTVTVQLAFPMSHRLDIQIRIWGMFPLRLQWCMVPYIGHLHNWSMA